jgi:hypothetical protein
VRRLTGASFQKTGQQNREKVDLIDESMTDAYFRNHELPFSVFQQDNKTEKESPTDA